nr:hypothetical protein [Tanacetum cinerariifolium]
MTLKDFLHFLGNPSISFFTRPADVPMSIGSPAGFATNVPDEELEMAIAALVANNAVGAKVVPPSAGRRWRGVVARPVGSPQRVIALSLDVDSKVVPDIVPSDEACKTLFGSLASTKDLGDSDLFLLGIEEARSSSAVRNELHWGGIFFPHAIERLLSSNHHSYALADLLEKAMLVCRSQYLKEVASSGIGVELVDMKDFDLNAE